MSNKNSRILDIAKFLIENENICLVIQGAWGVGKTCRWRKFVIKLNHYRHHVLNHASSHALNGFIN